MNKGHYQYTVRFFKRAASFFQRYGTKIHFNNFEHNDTLMRCGVISKKDLLRDLKKWETLACSTLMHRPVEILQHDQEIYEAQQKNLRSAVAVAALLTRDNSPEDEFYKNIIKIPHYKSYAFLTLMDSENPTDIIIDSRKDIKDKYGHIMKQQPFKGNFYFRKGFFHKKDDMDTRKLLMSHLNDNLFHNIDRVSFRSYEDDKDH